MRFYTSTLRARSFWSCLERLFLATIIGWCAWSATTLRPQMILGIVAGAQFTAAGKAFGTWRWARRHGAEGYVEMSPQVLQGGKERHTG